MKGIEAACTLTAAALAATMPAKVAELVDRYQLDPAPPAGQPEQPNTLAAPALYATSERGRLESEEWPAVLVVGLGLRSIRFAEIVADLDPQDEPNPAAGATTYLLTYRVRVYVYARGQDFDETDLARKRLMLAVREILLAGLALDTEGGAIDPLSLSESLSAVEPIAGSRTVAAGYLEIDVILAETAAPIPAGAVQAVTPIVTVVPAHPALD